MAVCNDKVCEAVLCGDCKDLIPSMCGNRVPNFVDGSCFIIRFEGVDDLSINQGECIDLTEGVHAYDGDGNEIDFTVTPSEIGCCAKDIISRTGGTVKLPRATNLYSVIKEQVDNLYAKTTDKTAKIRKISICYGNLADKSAEGYDLFTDIEAEEKERRLEYATIEIKDKFGKNAIIRGIDLDSKATTIQRNTYAYCQDHIKG